ncbi:HEPN domain-containing protein [Aliikangiella coralliicola]|uniref:HEPN domain-containing protein n=1 Tax=Aliikangiella coralliicola TaxID=2592383 RepID=A0A545UFU8_9GAMM|nr:HEPN domain-containing protein [Aliikangiella coralliicola]TQV88354.1 HEPN domain-containing protein [Aliikangiella coralliicola]
MKTSLEHLPEQKQQEILRAVEIICKRVQPEMVILFGSYARGDWVEDLDPQTQQYRYQSDYDILVITETRVQAGKIEQNRPLDQSLMHSIKRTPISLIAEDIEFINRRLTEHQYFYSDIKREGILLFDSGNFELAEPGKFDLQQRKELAEKDFEYWFNNAVKLFKGYHFYFEEEDYKEAVFLLHQVAERLYGAVLLVYTRYKPSPHDLNKLSHRVNSIEPQFVKVFPQGTEEEKTRFRLLRKAYINARYKPSYSISKEELVWLADRVEVLQEMTERLCGEKIGSFCEE